jgi:prepilin-type N-terminal cleavage/methylation domain-containing protein
MTYRTYHAGKSIGFTLVELLVVIAVVGLLVSIIIPALGRARDQANLLLCKVRLRNVCVGALLYAQDNNSYLPASDQFLPDPQGYENPHPLLIKKFEKGKYITDEQNYYCPSQKMPELMYSLENYAANKIGYFYFCCDIEYPTNMNISPFLVFETKWPRLLTTDMDPQTWVASDAWFGGMATSHKWYKKGVNWVMLDSSVNMLYKSPREHFK